MTENPKSGSKKNWVRSKLDSTNSGLRILYFILISLILWVVISAVVDIAYDCLPGGTRRCLATPRLLLRGGAESNESLWYFLVLPIAMLIAGLWVWPEDDDEPIYQTGRGGDGGRRGGKDGETLESA